MKIAVLGWGSLVWDPRGLRIKSDWFIDGPHLPIEFARKSKDGRITLVLHQNAERVQVLWAWMCIDNLDGAKENLRDREGTSEKYIECVDLEEPERCKTVSEISDEVRRWAKTKGVDAVVWTNLESNFEEKKVIEYLENLCGEERLKAKEYIRKTHPQIKTRIRQAIEQKLGWTPLS